MTGRVGVDGVAALWVVRNRSDRPGVFYLRRRFFGLTWK